MVRGIGREAPEEGFVLGLTDAFWGSFRRDGRKERRSKEGNEGKYVQFYK